MWVFRHEEGEDHLLDTQWVELLRSLNASEIGVSDIGDKPVVVIQPQDGLQVQGEVSLENFAHPSDCVYYFGHSHRHMTAEEIAGFNVIAKVYIPAPAGTALFANQAAAIVLWDRKVKGG